jgi:hypothetical protein
MPKTDFTQYDKDPANNTDVDGVDIAEGCAPSGINNAIRSVMSHIAEMNDGTVAMTSPVISGDLTVDTDTLYVDSTNNNVGIGTANPNSFFSGGNKLVVGDGSGAQGLTIYADSANHGQILFADGTTGNEAYRGIVRYEHVTDSMQIMTAGASERLRVDSSGNLMVGKTDTDFDVAGILMGGGVIHGIRNNAHPLALNRQTSAGDIIQFYKDGASVGAIGAGSPGTMYVSSSQAGGLRFTYVSSSPVTLPCTTTGANLDNSADLGASSVRFDDIYATNGTIQTSDRNEKENIASMSDAEITAAKAISKLFKTFKWKDAVAEKGDSARTHAGVIAQDVQQAMSDAGLDAGDYAFFISSTWWETKTEVPAVAEETDEEGNVTVEAQEAYTRTDIYDTAEEAPEGATERTRLGIRYPELLAFIGAATEQRLASIEARLDALEA